MKPQAPFSNRAGRRFLVTDFCFQSNLSDWRGSSWPDGGDDDDSPARRFHRFNQEFRREMMRERQREWILFAGLMLVVAWPVFYMLYCVLRLVFGR
ncbi:MAG: hypothetical protein H0X40_06080 [Chthoniobacterales bacterium]|nr:hypothetical protein [Chthoniobacterales bacterium]